MYLARHLQLDIRPLPLLVEGRVFCKTLAISVDPNMRPMVCFLAAHIGGLLPPELVVSGHLHLVPH